MISLRFLIRSRLNDLKNESMVLFEIPVVSEFFYEGFSSLKVIQVEKKEDGTGYKVSDTIDDFSEHFVALETMEDVVNYILPFFSMTSTLDFVQLKRLRSFDKDLLFGNEVYVQKGASAIPLRGIIVPIQQVDPVLYSENKHRMIRDLHFIPFTSKGKLSARKVERLHGVFTIQRVHISRKELSKKQNHLL